MFLVLSVLNVLDVTLIGIALVVCLFRRGDNFWFPRFVFMTAVSVVQFLVLG